MTDELKIQSVKRIQGRAVLTLSNGDSLSMPRAMLKERPYRSGTPFDRAAYEAFIRDRSYPFALEKAVGMLAMRARSRKELRDTLCRNAYPEATVNRVLARMEEAGCLSDADFAKGWAASRNARSIGARRISMELRQKGVSNETIEETLDELDEDDVFQGALRLGEKAARGKNLSSPADRQKISAALVRRGYDYGTARKVLSILMQEST